MDYFNNCNFSKHELMRFMMMVLTVKPKPVGAVLMLILILFFKTTHLCISW